ncbi:MAG: DUF3267 domain-containing protein [Deltaproteobacteria bacterium]
MQELFSYEKEKLTIDIINANIIAIVLIIPCILIFGLPFYLIWKNEIDFTYFSGKKIFSEIPFISLYIFVTMIAGIIIHELIHGIVWAIYSNKGFKSIKIGILWKLLTPYCHCSEPLKLRHYMAGAIAPSIILGFLPSILAVITGSTGLLLFGIIFTVAAAGDFMILYILRNENKDDLVLDHPSEAGCYIFREKRHEKNC